MVNQVTVRNVLARYWNGHARTNVMDKNRIRVIVRWLDDFLGHLTLNKLTDAKVSAYIEARKAGKLGKNAGQVGTIRRELGCLRTALRYAARQKLISSDDVPHVYLPPAPKPKDFWLTPEEVKQMRNYLLLNMPLSRVRFFVEIALATGARKRSIEILKWDDVDLTEKVIRFDNQVETQTRKRRVSVPMSDRLYSFFMTDNLIPEYGNGQVEYVLGRGDTIRHEFDRLRKALAKHYNAPRFLKMTPHTLRHTAATHLLRNGASLWQVSGILGDAPETVAKTYGHHVTDHLREAANLMNKGAE